MQQPCASAQEQISSSALTLLRCLDEAIHSCIVLIRKKHVSRPLPSFRNRALAALTLIGVVLAPSCASRQSPQVDRVLFVGNSLTYVGNVPAVFEALSNKNGKPVASDMIVEGGATLEQRLGDGSVARALAANRYAAVVLQERGGDLFGGFGPDARLRSRQAIRALAQLARDHGAETLLLGSYQTDPAASERLVAEEALAAAEAVIPYLPVSEVLQRARVTEPALAWFASDGMHPGQDLALLDAVLVYKALHGTYPAPALLAVRAPIYGSSSGLSAQLRRADDPPPLPGTPLGLEYAAERIQRVIRAMHHVD